MSADDKAPEAEAGQAPDAASNAVNSQILDALAAIEASGADQVSAHSAAMLNLASAHAAALGMYNMVARQQADAAIASATVAALSARMVGSRALPGTGAPPVEGLVAAAAAQAEAAVSILRGLAAAGGEEGARAAAALRELADAAKAAAPPPPPPGRQGSARRKGTRGRSAPSAGG